MLYAITPELGPGLGTPLRNDKKSSSSSCFALNSSRMRLVSSANQQQQQQQQQQPKRVEATKSVHKATCKRKLSPWQLRLSKNNEIKTGCTFSSLLFVELESLVLLLLVKFAQNTRGMVGWQHGSNQTRNAKYRQSAK